MVGSDILPRLSLDKALALLDAGGPVVWLLVVLSIAALAVALLKFVQFVRRGVGRKDPALEAIITRWRAGEQAAAGRAAERLGGARAHLVAAAMALVTRYAGTSVSGTSVSGVNISGAPLPGASPSASPSASLGASPGARFELGREDLENQALAYLRGLRSHLRVLEATSQLAPLIGLFGTVIGMMRAFEALQSAGSAADPAALAGGIWTALITTAVGLAAAIPAAFALYWFDGRLAAEQAEIERALTRVLTTPPIAPPTETGSGPETAAEPEARQTAPQTTLRPALEARDAAF